MKKTALILIPETENLVIRHAYIQACIRRVEEEGFLADCPFLIESISKWTIRDYIDDRLPWADIVYIFVDFGMDQLVLDYVDRMVREGRANMLKYVRLKPIEIRRVQNEPVFILSEISNLSGYLVDDITSKTRKREIVDIRKIYCKRCKIINPKLSLNAIGGPIGKDHATVYYSIKEANKVAELKALYDFYYGKTKSKEEALAPRQDRDQANGDQGEGSILSSGQVDQGEQDIQANESLMSELQKTRFYNAFGGYRPHNS